MKTKSKIKIGGFRKFLYGIPLWALLFIAADVFFQKNLISIILYVLIIAIAVWYNNSTVIIYDKVQECLKIIKVRLYFIRKTKSYELKDIKFVAEKEYTGSIYKVPVIRIIKKDNKETILKFESSDIGFSEVKNLMLELGYPKTEEMEL